MSCTNKLELERDKCEVFNSGSKNRLHEYTVGKSEAENSSPQQKTDHFS